MRTAIIIALILFFGRTALAQIVLSEIMFNPAGNERYDEFIELYNTSEIESVDLAAWLLSDSSKFNLILPYDETALLLPEHYAVIFGPNYFENSDAYDDEIPEEVLLLTIGNAQFGAYGLKNSEGERVSVHRPDSTLVAAFKYSPDNKDGFSEEKIDLFGGDALENWSNSIKSGGTPGYKNSVTLSAFDLMLSSISMTPERPGRNDSLYLEIGVRNVGKELFDYFELEIFKTTENDDNLIFSQGINHTILPEDSIIHRIVLPCFVMGEHLLTARISNDRDENEMNNSKDIVFEVVASYPAGSVVINEIMYDTDEKSDEWLELFNTTPDSILLKEWRIRDMRKSVVLCDSMLFMPPGGYLVLANTRLTTKDSLAQLILSLPELNNSGDELALCDATGAVIDSVAYTKLLGGDRNISLERIRYELSTMTENWNSCIDPLGATPGRQNSISPKSRDAAIDGASLNFDPEKPIANENVVVSLNLLNSGREPAFDIVVNFSYAELNSSSFNIIGSQQVASLAVYEEMLVSYKWDNIPAGVFVIIANLSMPGDLVGSNNSAIDTVFVSDPNNSLIINEIMHSPAEGEGEWFELMNTCSRPVKLFGCSFGKSDSSKQYSFGETQMTIDVGGFVLVAKDSSFIHDYEESVIVLKSMPSLKNDADSIYIYDGNGRVVDFVHYSDQWGGAKGRSLERINPRIDSNEPTNWTTCVSVEGHTSCAQNSVMIEHMPKTTTLEVLPNPFSPDGDGFDDFTGISFSLPATTAQVNVKIYDIQGRLVRFLLNNEPSSARRTVFWDGLNYEGRRCRIGVYIVFFEALNESVMCVERARTTVVLAGAL
jgi:hypothetical protein